MIVLGMVRRAIAKIVLFAAASTLTAACGPAVEIGGELRTSLEEQHELPDAGPRTPRYVPDAGPRNESCPEPTLTSIREKVFLQHCGTGMCHVGAMPAADLDLTLPIAELGPRLLEPALASVSGLVLVKPGAYGASYLYLKVFLETPSQGTQMPPSAHLDDCAVDTLRDWIAAGAPN